MSELLDTLDGILESELEGGLVMCEGSVLKSARALAAQREARIKYLEGQLAQEVYRNSGMRPWSSQKGEK